jgi:hypothetical protein
MAGALGMTSSMDAIQEWGPLALYMTSSMDARGHYGWLHPWTPQREWNKRFFKLSWSSSNLLALWHMQTENSGIENLQNNNINHGNVLLHGIMLLFRLKEKCLWAHANWCKLKKSAYWNWQNNRMNHDNVPSLRMSCSRLAHCLRLLLSDWCVLVFVNT